MRTNIARASVVAFGLLALGASTLSAQSDPQYAPRPDPQYDASPEYDQDGSQYGQNRGRYGQRRELLALQDDLVQLDDNLTTVSWRHPRRQEFQRRADAIRRDVTALADDVRLHREYRDGYGDHRAEIAALRASIAQLRDDVENAQSRRRGRATFIPAGTDIQVILEQDLSSRSNNPEDRVEASTITAVRLNGWTVIPAGATVSGSVREVRSRRRGQHDGWLKVDFDTLTPNGGQPLPIRSHVVAVSENRSDSRTLRNGGLGALLGGVLGGIIDGKKGALIGAAVGAGGGILASRRDDDVDLPEGTVITLRLDRPMTLARR